VRAQQGLGVAIADLDVSIEQAHQHAAADLRRTRRVAAVIDADARVVGDGAFALGEVAEALQRQRAQVGALLLEHALDLAAGRAVDARRCPPGFPQLQESVLLVDGLEAAALERRALGVLDRFSTVPSRLGSRTLAGSATTP
jgi:hypothetical protein